MRRDVSSVEELRKSLAQLPDEMKVEVAPGVAISAQTVRDLRALSSIPGKLRLSRPSGLPYLQIPVTWRLSMTTSKRSLASHPAVWMRPRC
jgi:hypothetical protein